MKLNLILAASDHANKVWAQLKSNYISYFKNKQSAFRGEKRTYVAAEGTIDEPSKRGNTLVVETVGEKLDYMVETVSPYFNTLLNIEATNAGGAARADIQILDNTYNLSSLELLRLKHILEELTPIYSDIPVRTDNEIWNTTNSADYTSRPGIWETPLSEGPVKTTLKDQYILPDPNVANLKDSTKYTPVVSSRDTVVTLGHSTLQKFSGEWSHRDRALLLARRSQLLEQVIVALKKCNEAEVVESQLTASVIFKYLHG